MDNFFTLMKKKRIPEFPILIFRNSQLWPPKSVARQISTGQNSTDIFLQTFFYHDIFLPEGHFSTKTFFYQDLFLPLLFPLGHFSTMIFLELDFSCQVDKVRLGLG